MCKVYFLSSNDVLLPILLGFWCHLILCHQVLSLLQTLVYLISHIGVCGGLLVSALDWHSWGLGFKFQQERSLLHLHPIANSAMTAHCQWEDETTREGTSHPPSYAEATKKKWLTLHADDCPRASLRDGSSSSSTSSSSSSHRSAQCFR